MKRKVQEINTAKLRDGIPELQDSIVRIYIDIENNKSKKEIEKILTQAGTKKLNTIFGCMLRGSYMNSIYKRETKGVTTIKLKGGASKNQNLRIYCKEFYDNGKRIIIVTPLIKKVQKNADSERIINIIEKIKGLEY